MSEEERDGIFKAYIQSLGEEPAQYRKDADKLAELAEACSGPDDMIPSASGSEVCQTLVMEHCWSHRCLYMILKHTLVVLFHTLFCSRVHLPGLQPGILSMQQYELLHGCTAALSMVVVTAGLLLAFAFTPFSR